MPYANKECDDCHIVLPANRMVERSGRIQMGQSKSTYKRTGEWFPHSSRTTKHYRDVSYYQCEPCYLDWKQREARRRIRNLIATIAILGGLIGAMAVLSLRPPTEEKLPPALSATNAVSPERQPSDKDDVTLPVPEEYGPEPAPIATPAADSGPVDESRSDAAVAVLSDIEADIQIALEQGETRLWKRHGKSGYVVPSGLQPASDEPCRSFIVTIIDGREQSQTKPIERCFSKAAGRWLSR